MKTEELLRYEGMYAEIRKALGTPWLDFRHPSQTKQDLDYGSSTTERVMREVQSVDTFQPANDSTEHL